MNSESMDYHKDFDGNFILDENDEMIPMYICICAAWSENECVCGAWYYPLPDENRSVYD